MSEKTETCLLVKTASEIALKSDFVRRFFTKKLVRNIRFALKQNKVECGRILHGGGRLYVFCSNQKKALKLLSLVPGIHAVALAEQGQFSDYENIEKTVLEFAKGFMHKGNTFALAVTVSGNKDFSRRDLEVRLGAVIQREIKDLTVNLGNPEKKMFIEVRKKDFFIYTKQSKGIAGLPLGVQGNVALFVTGKKPELLAAFLMMRRGCNVFPIVTKENAKLKKFVERLKPLNSHRKFFLTEQKAFENLVSEREIQAIVTADSKVDAKSLAAYKRFDSKQSLAVLRPLPLYPKKHLKELEKLLG